MTHNLTETQQNLARWLVAERQAGRIDEFFSVATDAIGRAMIRDNTRFPYTEEGARILLLDCPSFTNPSLDALAAEGMLLAEGKIPALRRFTFRRRIYDAVRHDFRDQPALPQAHSAAASPHAPHELALSLERLRRSHPDPAKLGCYIAPATHDGMGDTIFLALKKTAARHELAILSPEETQFHADPWANIRTILHGCSFGIVAYEYAGGEEPGANAGIAIGYLLALHKPVLLLRGCKVSPQQTDLLRESGEDFDEEDPEHSIPGIVERWLMENGVILYTPEPAPNPNGSTH